MILISSQNLGALGRLSLLLGFPLAALAVIPLSSVGFILPKNAVLSVCALLGFLSVMRRRNCGPLSPLTCTFAGWMLLAFVALLVLSPLWSAAPLLSFVGAPPRFEGILTRLLTISFALLALPLAREGGGARFLCVTLLWSSGLVVAYGMLQALGLDPLARAWDIEHFLGRTFSTMGQPNVLGQFLLLTLPFVAYSAARSQGCKRAFFALLLLAHFVVLLQTGSRAALFGLAVMGLVACVVLRNEILSRCFPLRPVPILITAACVLLLTTIGTVSYSERFGAEAVGGRSLSARGIIAGIGFRMIAARPWGWGLETTGIVSPRFTSSEFLNVESLTTEIDRLHSKPLDLLVTLGLPGLLLFYSFLFALLLGAWRTWRKKNDMAVLAAALGLLGSEAALLFGFGSVLTEATGFLLVGFLLGNMSEPSVDLQSASSSSSARRGLYLLFSVALFISIASVAQSFSWMRARLVLERAERLLPRGEEESALLKVAEARALFPLDRGVLIRSTEVALSAVERAADEKSRERLLTFSREGIATLAKLTAGEDGMVPLLALWHAAQRDDPAGVLRAYEQAVLLKPASVTTYRIAFTAFSLLGDAARATEAEQDLLRLLPSDALNPNTPRGRILWQEHPWLSPLP